MSKPKNFYYEASISIIVDWVLGNVSNLSCSFISPIDNSSSLIKTSSKTIGSILYKMHYQTKVEKAKYKMFLKFERFFVVFHLFIINFIFIKNLEDANKEAITNIYKYDM
jgi:hypothetical protein